MPSMSKKIAVAILNWNGADLLKRFLPGVLKYSQEEAIVYVIDNNSTDNSVAVLKRDFKEVKIIVIPENLGYAGGYNKGLEWIDEEYVVLLNSDVEVTQNWLTPLIARLEADPKLAALQPKILDLKSPDKFEYAGAAGGFFDALGYPFCRGRIFDELETDQNQYNDYKSVFWASGACLVVRKSTYLQVGQLNEDLFAHMEEIDLCWRMQLHGFEVGCDPTSTVFHLGGATLNKQSPQKTYLNFRNNLIILFLNLPQGEAMLTILKRLVLDGLAGIQFLLKGKIKHVVAIIRAHFAFYGRFNSLMRQKVGQPVKPLKQLNGVYPKSLVWAYFVQKKKNYSDL